MSTLPEADLDLEKLFLPAWAQKPDDANRFANYTGNEGGRPEGRRDDRRGPRAGGGGGRGGGGGGGGGGRRDDRGPRRDGGGRGPGPGRGDQRRDARPEFREAPEPLPQVNVVIAPDDTVVDSLSRQIRMSARAFPLFEIAHLVLQKPERQVVRFEIIKKPDGTAVQQLFLCALDDTVWLSEAEAVEYVLNKHFATFYQADRVQIAAPKGTYTFVAQCGFSGVILGPPNHHDYQNQLRKLHTERFARMPFEAFKARVRIVKDEAVVKKWIDDQSWKTEFVVLNVPDSLRLPTREAVEKHFRENHLANIIRPVDSHSFAGDASRNQPCRALIRLLRLEWEDQRRFPIKMASQLSQRFAGAGLQLFKRDKVVTLVSVARPHFLDLEAAPVSDGIRRIIEFINAHPKCKRSQVVEALAPTPKPVVAPLAVPDPAAPAAPAAPVPLPAPTSEQTAVVADIHWLLHQGHILEFANGIMETAKRPLPRPVKPEPKPAAAAPAGAAAPADATASAVPAETPAAETAPAAVESVVSAPAENAATPEAVENIPTAADDSTALPVTAPPGT